MYIGPFRNFLRKLNIRGTVVIIGKIILRFRHALISLACIPIKPIIYGSRDCNSLALFNFTLL